MKKIHFPMLYYFLVFTFILTKPSFGGGVINGAGVIDSFHFDTFNGTIYSVTIKDKAYHFDHARYTMFIPKGVKRIRGIFVHQHGCGMQGIGASTPYDLQYQAFAEKWDLAVIGPDLFPHAHRPCRGSWVNPDGDGSGDSFLKALGSLGRMSDHSEIADAPWLLWGHSGGGYWVLQMIRLFPRRVIAAVCYSAAFNPVIHFPEEVQNIPILLRHAGSHDFNAPGINCWKTAENIFSQLRKSKGFVSIAFNKNQNHNLSYIRYVTIPFFEAALSKRLPKDPAAPLKKIDRKNAWLGDTSTLNIYPFSRYVEKSREGSLTRMCLFPDSLSAVAWKAFVRTNKVKAAFPPPTPVNLDIRGSGVNAVLTWEPRSSVYAPIDHFNIYFNDDLAGRFPKRKVYQDFNTNGDNTMPPLPQPIFFNINTFHHEKGSFSVSAVDKFGNESSRTKIIN